MGLSETSKFWWCIRSLDPGTEAIRLAYSTAITGPWIVDAGDPCVCIGGDGGILKKFGNKWYIYYAGSGNGAVIYRADSNDVNGPYVNTTTILTPDSVGTWARGRVAEPDVVYRPRTNDYLMAFMGGDYSDPCADANANWIEYGGFATSPEPNSVWTMWPGNPVIKGGHTYDAGEVKGADPILFQLDPCSGIWYLGVTITASAKTTYKIAYFYSTDINDLNTWTPLHGNPIISTSTGGYAANGAYRGGAPVDVGGVWYVPVQGTTNAQWRVCGGIGTLTSTTPVAGKIGKATVFNTSGAFSITGTMAGFTNTAPNNSNGATISMWSNPSTIANLFFSRGGSPMMYFGTSDTNSFDLCGQAFTGTASSNKHSSPVSDFRNVWHQYAMRYDGTNVIFYLDGVNVGSDASSGTWSTSSSDAIGNTLVIGLFDELRVSNKDRGENWIKTSYNNQNNPLTFWSGGAAP